jgi:hypothetical protein
LLDPILSENEFVINRFCGSELDTLNSSLKIVVPFSSAIPGGTLL